MSMVRLAAAHEAVALLIDLALMANIACNLRSDGVVEFPSDSGGVVFYARALMMALYGHNCACWTVEFCRPEEFTNTCFLRAVLERPLHPMYTIFSEVFSCLISPAAKTPPAAGLEASRFVGTGLRRVVGKNKTRECIGLAQVVLSGGEWTKCFEARSWHTTREELDFRRFGKCSWLLPLEHIPQLYEVGNARLPSVDVLFRSNPILHLPEFFKKDHKAMLQQGNHALTLLQESTSTTRENGVLHRKFRDHAKFRYMFPQEDSASSSSRSSRSRSRSPRGRRIQ